MRRLAIGLCCVAILAAALVPPAAAETRRQRGVVAFKAGYAAMARRDYVRARRAFERALALGARGAGYNLGLIHAFGWGVKADQGRACGYYRIASRARLPKAMHNLATCFYTGRGRPRDYRKAMAW